MVKFKITRSIADVSTFKMCCTWEKREVASFSAVFVQGIIDSSPSMKSLYNKKGTEQDPTRTKRLQWITPTLSPHTGGRCSHSSLSTPEFLCDQCMRNWKCTPQGRIWPPSQATSEDLAFPWKPAGMDTAKHRPCSGEPGQGVTVSLASPDRRNVWATEGQLCWSGRAERERTEQSTIPWNLDWEGCVSLEISFHQNAPPNDWQLHPRT